MRLVRRLSLETAEASGLTLNQALLLVRLREGARTMTDLKHELDVTTGAVTGLVDRLERLGLVQRTANAEDRRVVCLTLTEEGARAQSVFAALWESRVSAWLDGRPQRATASGADYQRRPA